MDRYHNRRSPDRERGRYGPPPGDNYVPQTGRPPRPRSRSAGGYRRRSRTPPRPQNDNWRGRPQSPPGSRRYDGMDAYPSRDGPPRSPRRDFVPVDTRYDAPRGVRPRSPIPMKRGRELSPRMRSPAPPKRERPATPPREYERIRSPRRQYSPPRAGYRPRSRSPMRRDERVDPYVAKTWRRRTPSPPRSVRLDGSGRNSGTTSRRTSPRPYPGDARAPIAPPPMAYRQRSPPLRREPTPPQQPRPSYREEVDPYHHAAREPHDREYASNGDSYAEPYPAAPDYRDRAPPTGPANHGPPTGPALVAAPPPGPAAGVSMSAHNRPAGNFAPAYPRAPGGYRGRGGGHPPPREPYQRDYGPPRRGSYGSYAGRGGPPRESYPPRDGYDARGQPSYRSRDGPPPNFRGSSNSTSTTYPQTRRFNNPPATNATSVSTTSQHLSDLPTLKAGGERLPPLFDPTKADRLEEEAARIRKRIELLETQNRQGGREWSRLERESSSAGLKSELAEEHLRNLSGENEGVGAGAAF